MKAFFLILALVLPLQASAARVIYNLRGQQSMADLPQTGWITADAEIIWDERIHGDAGVLPGDPEVLEAYEAEEPLMDNEGQPVLAEPQPVFDSEGKQIFDEDGHPVLVGGGEQVMKKVRRLRVSMAKLADHLEKKRTKKEAEDLKAAKKEAMKLLRAKVKDKSAKLADVLVILEDLLERSGD